ncbi:MAG: toprim domain-containing protein [Magnetococcus sp. WYHC-3]
MSDLQAYLHKHVDVEQFYRIELENFTPGGNTFCPFHKDTTPSLSINTDNLGEFYCHSAKCGAHGTSFIGYYVRKYGVAYTQALNEIYTKYIRPIIPVETILDYHIKLSQIPALHQWLLTERGLTYETIQYYKLGFDGSRLTIPIEDQFGNIVNVRRYDVSKKSDAKMLSYEKGYGRATLFPMSALEGNDIVLVEGELDCLLGRQIGLNCICSTGGAGYWNQELSDLLANKRVIILYDNDDAGMAGAGQVATALSAVCHKVLMAKYDINGADLTDYIIRHHRKVDDIAALIREATLIADGSASTVGQMFKRVRLQDAAHASMRGIPIEFKAHVAGKDIQPYVLPKRVRLTCLSKPEEKCPACQGPEPYVSIINIDMSDERILGLINCTENQLKHKIKALAKCRGRCNVRVEVIESINVEELKLVAPIEESGEQNEFKYVMRTAIAKTYNLDANATYIFRGYMYPDPESQHAIFLIIDYEHSADQLDHFALTKERKDGLRKIFPGGSSIDSIHAFLDDFYEYLSQNVTKIYQRRALHQSVDLAFHSALGFNFNNEFIRRGWLDVLIMGDTRTGKGYVTDRLCKYYRVGEVASGENCTFAGLVGGVQQIGARRTWAITWGFIPRNDRRLVVIDEASAVTGETLSRMSRVRSEGVAEVFKIVTERTMARTRTIWNANPADGRSVREFEHGVEAILTMAERKEDISRFDYAITIASDEVSSDIINTRRHVPSEERVGLSDACRDLILWIWSRKPHQIIFDSDAIQFILNESVTLGKRYHYSIPLVQAENIREKLAKIAVAIAGRCYSTDSTGEVIVVTKACAEYAVGFLHYLYTREAMAYDVYSALQYERNELLSEDGLIRMIATHKERAAHFIGDMLENQKITVKFLEASLGVDYVVAKEIRNEMLKLRAIKAEYSWWVKREPFIRWLRQMRTISIQNPMWWKEYVS